MPGIAGTLTITAGVIDLLSAFVLFMGTLVVQGISGFAPVPLWIPLNASVVLFFVSLPFLICGIVAIMGGIYSVQRRSWGLALAGSIIAFFPFCIFGLVSVILLTLSKDEFASVSQPVARPVSQAI